MAYLFTDPVQITVLTPDSAAESWENVFFSAVLALLCDMFRPEELTNQEAPYCWSETNTSLPTACDTPGCNNWYDVPYLMGSRPISLDSVQYLGESEE